jgi:alpha-beta hydrolase superfamily lysophospholipase
MSIISSLEFSIPLDIYPPQPLFEADDSSLVILILQGIEIDKSEYTAIATELSRHQFWVIVPNCYPAGRDYLCPENNSAAKVMAELQSSKSQPLDNALQRGVILLGHSAGGMAAFGALEVNSPEPLSKIRAIVGYGSNAPFNANLISPLPPILMLSGAKDSVVPKEFSKSAFQRMSTSPKTFLELTGLNHYSINDSPQPMGAPPEKNRADLGNQNSVRLIAYLLKSFIRAVQSQQENWLSDLDNDAVSVIQYSESDW